MKFIQNIFITLFILAFVVVTLLSCNKETATTQTEVMNSLLTNKNWYLDYSITGTSTKSYVGQATYFVTYLKDGTTKDSDGLMGIYTVELINNQSQIHVQVKTANGNPLEVVYNIISVGETKLILSKLTTGTPTALYFTNK
jgi:Gpi18-like mannosyltransferase